MSTHLIANANVSLESNANANAILQECIQMQICWGRIQMQIFLLHIKINLNAFTNFVNAFKLILNVLALY